MNSNELADFDALDWIDRYFSGQATLDYEQLRPVLCFSLIWNVFESIACNRNANPTAIRRSVDRAHSADQLDSLKYSRYVKFFRTRYLHDGTIDEAFNRLLMTDRNSQTIVHRVLNGDDNDSNNVVYALLLIAHRIRNNLFHGNKNVTGLHRQVELFQVVNHLLSDYVEDISPEIPSDLFAA
jgi:hypothetical protein